MLDPRITEKVQNSFNQQGFMNTLKAKITKIELGLVEIEAPIQKEHCQQQGFGHGGVTFSLGDSAAGYAALTTLPPESEVIAVEVKINMLRPAVGDKLLARGKVVKTGKRLVVVTADIFAIKDGVEKQIALLQGTAMPV